MNRTFAIIFSLVVVVAGLGALAHITTGKALIISRTKTVHDTVAVHDTIHAKENSVTATEYVDGRDTILYVSCVGKKTKIIHYTGALDWTFDSAGVRLTVTNTNGGYYVFSGPMTEKNCTVSHVRVM